MTRRAVKFILPVSLILVLSALGILRRVPLWACLFVGIGISDTTAFLIDFFAFIATDLLQTEDDKDSEWEHATTPLNEDEEETLP